MEASAVIFDDRPADQRLSARGMPEGTRLKRLPLCAVHILQWRSRTSRFPALLAYMHIPQWQRARWRACRRGRRTCTASTGRRSTGGGTTLPPSGARCWACRRQGSCTFTPRPAEVRALVAYNKQQQLSPLPDDERRPAAYFESDNFKSLRRLPEHLDVKGTWHVACSTYITACIALPTGMLCRDERC